MRKCVPSSELDFAAKQARDINVRLSQDYRDSCYSFGYSVYPNLDDQRRLLERFKRIRSTSASRKSS